MLAKSEIKQLAELLKRVSYPRKDLPEPVFEALCRVVPFAACEIIAQDARGRLLLVWRDDKWWHGWHFPGGLMRAGETLEDRIKKTARKELGTGVKQITFLKPISARRPDKRGYVISLLFLCALAGEPKKGRYFFRMPDEIIPGHDLLWREAVKIIRGKGNGKSF